MSENKNKILVQKAIDVIQSGKSLQEALVIAGLPSKTFFDTKDKDPDLAQAYALAQRARAEHLVEEIVTISDTELDAQRSRNRIDARKWYASKMQPQKYGDRLELNVNQTVDIGKALSEAKARMLPMRDPNLLVDRDVVEIATNSLNDNAGVKPVADEKEGQETGDASEKASHSIFD